MRQECKVGRWRKSEQMELEHGELDYGHKARYMESGGVGQLGKGAKGGVGGGRGGGSKGEAVGQEAGRAKGKGSLSHNQVIPSQGGPTSPSTPSLRPLTHLT